MKRGGRAYWKLYLSYAIIFCIPFLMGFTFYLYVYHSVKVQADTTNNSLMRIVKKNCDNEIMVYENILIQLALNQNIQELSIVKREFTSQNAYSLYVLQNEIASLKASSNRYGNYFADIFVYFKNSDKIVSANGNMSFQEYYDLYYPGTHIEIEEFKQYLSEYRYLDMQFIGYENEKTPLLLMTMTNLKGDYGETTANIGVVLDTKELSEIIETAAWGEGVIPLLINSDNQVLNCPKGMVEGFNLEYSQLEEEIERNIIWNQEKYIAQVMNSDLTDWKYVLMMPESLILGEVSKIKNIFFVEIIICFLAGIWATTQMVKINYNPLKNLLEIFQKQKGDEDYGNNEYVYLKKKAHSLINEHENYRQILLRDKEIVKKYYLTRVLENPYDESYFHKKREVLGENFRQGQNMVLVFSATVSISIEENEERYTEENSLKKFIIGNVFLEGIGELFTAEVVELGDSIAMIVNMSRGKEEYEKLLGEQIEGLQRFVQENFKFQVKVASGGLHEGLPGIHDSFIEAKEAEEFIALLESDYITYEEIRNIESKQYDYSYEKEEKILSAIRLRKEILAISYVNRVLAANYQKNTISPFMLKCLMYDLIGTLMKGADELGSTGVIEEYKELKIFSAKRALEDLQTIFARMIHDICARNQEVSENSKEQNDELSRKIVEYVQNNYHDPDLNISQTGLHFHMTPAYLSSVFKKQTGESLLKLINQIRMEEAEKLLLKGHSVVEVTEWVGFREPSTFIRAFKKTTGLTPGQIKSNRTN